jgi:murein DD-endopeptidase MepM/ murein hydrolase activator NlpD
MPSFVRKHSQHYIFEASLVALLSNLFCPLQLQADIYRFITIDGVETFTDTPLKKDAQVVVKETSKNLHKKSARNISRDTNRTPTPSLQEIIEKTIQAQIFPKDKLDSVEALLPVNGIITSGVGMRIDPIDGAWRHHNGIDIAVPEGTPVHSVADGTVVFSGLRSGYGWTVLIEHDNGMITLYGHNSRNNVTQGQMVKRGEAIALAGSTGRSTGPHVHFEAWQSGNNITGAFMPGSSIKVASITGNTQQKWRFRKEILADGSLLITNIPLSIP